jgi:serine O-acetyltransferase
MSVTLKSAPAERVDPVWSRMREEAEAMAAAEPLMASLAHGVVLRHESLEDALSFRLAQKLGAPDMPEMVVRELAAEALAADPTLRGAARADLVAVRERDPACTRFIEPLLFFKGFLALVTHRVAHWMWREGRRDVARWVQMRGSEMFAIDIHPAARLGSGLMLDHGHAIVIGETAVVGDEVSMLHGVTLGGTGKEDGDRHPKIGDGVLIGAGASILGNIRVGACSRVAAGSVVLAEVPPCKTVAGVPARVVGDAGCSRPSRSMDQLVRVGEDAADIVPDC